MQGTLKIFILVAAVGALSAGAYFLVGNKAEGQTGSLLKSEVTGNPVGIPTGNASTEKTIQDVLRQINDLDQINLNTEIFDSPEFLSLKDISQELPTPTDVGRPNPFAPIGVDVGTVFSDDFSQVVTFQDTGADQGFVPIFVQTNQVQNVGQRSATASGETAIPTTTSRWFEWGTNQNTVNKTAKQTGVEASFTATLTGLNPDTMYYVKSAVEDNGLVTYGNLISFKTAK